MVYKLLVKISVFLCLVFSVSFAWCANLMSVNGQFITSEIADAAYSAHIKQSNMHLLRDRDLILDDLLKKELLKQEALKLKLDQLPNTKILRELSQQKALAESFHEYVLRTAPTNEVDESQLYQDLIKHMDQSAQMRISAIFLNDNAEALEVIKKLTEGQSFSELAEKYSKIGPVRKNVGDLGWFSTDDQSIPPKVRKLISMKNGQFLAEPVELPGKFAVLEKSETRQFTPPPFEALKPKILNALREREWHKINDQVYDALAAKKARLSPKILNLAVSETARKEHSSISQEWRNQIEGEALKNRDLAKLASKQGIETDSQVASELYVADQDFLSDLTTAHFIKTTKVSNADLESYRKKFKVMNSGVSKKELQEIQIDDIKSHKFDEYLERLKTQAKIEKYPFYDSWVSNVSKQSMK